jgi:hypothetical protein
MSRTSSSMSLIFCMTVAMAAGRGRLWRSRLQHAGARGVARLDAGGRSGRKEEDWRRMFAKGLEGFGSEEGARRGLSFEMGLRV